MKKIFSLLAAMSTVLCANATDLTFEVEVHDNVVTVTPSEDDVPYFCAPLDQEVIDLMEEHSMFDLSKPENLFIVAAGVYPRNYFTGVSTLTCHNGNHTLVMCEYETEENGFTFPKGEIYTMPITINIDIDEPVFDPLTFTVECDNDGFTITPSDDVQEYVATVFTLDDVKELEAVEGSVDIRMQMWTIIGLIKDHIYQGTSSHTLEDAVIEEVQGTDGPFVIVVMGVKRDVDRYVITTPVYQYDWVIDHNTTDLHAINASARIAKMLKDGKFILNGSVLIDGRRVKE